ncbi:MAG TPA: DUF5777 family beta-barrel protein [Thermoanaerobaculia bacterium]|nr:DUF5777 family beta-barrel protein [Thermoanaerobaculia bacterium]
MTRTTIAILLLIAPLAAAQDQYTPAAPLPLGDILLSLPTSHMPDRGTWEVRFAHRFNQSIDEGEAIHNLFGLDGGANVTMGLSYVPRRDVQLSIQRSNILDTLEMSGKYLALQQAPAIPVSAALRGGAAWRTERDIDDRLSWFAQAILSRQFGRRFAIYALPTFATDAGRGLSGTTSGALFEEAFNVPIGISFMVRPATSLIVELVPPNGDLPDDVESDIGWAVGIKRALGGHYFEILLTNNNATTADQYVSSTYQGAPLRQGDIQLGFNIERRFGRRR